MSSRKQEERNEKVIRGLMKLPPNRKCINCNSLGPQYVCTNFWTFVCMTCSGIHREFTHRVKSVSMSKFTSEEVEALQNGGNQRAREIFLRDWDPQSERFPNNSNAEKVRQLIKDVYVDRKYAGENNSGKPPKDKQKLRNHEDETRRASSYHSYSQSPPYDYQYEERRYGKQAAPSLSRKPGSDRGIYKAYGGFLSPSRLSDHVSEKSRVSDYSLSSGGDPFRSGPQSPTFQRDVGYCSPSNAEISSDISSVDLQQHQKLNTFADTKAPPLQRTTSVDSGRSLNSISSNSANSGYNVNAVTSSVSDNFDSLDLFSAPFVSQTVTSTAAAAIDLFQLPHALSTSSLDFFQRNPNLNITSQNSLPPSLSLFPDLPQQEENEGWATFSQAFDSSTPATIPSTVGEKTDQFIFLNASLQQPSFPEFHGSSSSSMLNQWDSDLPNGGTLFNAITPRQSWNAFEDSSGQQDFQSLHQQSSSQVAAQNPSSIADQYHGFGVLEDLNRYETKRATLSNDPIFGMSAQAGVHSQAPDKKSTNPFDLPYDSDMESANMLLELSSLQAALPIGQPWFPQDPVDPFGPQGFMGPQLPSPQIQNIPTQAPVASSVGGNPFA